MTYSSDLILIVCNSQNWSDWRSLAVIANRNSRRYRIAHLIYHKKIQLLAFIKTPLINFSNHLIVLPTSWVLNLYLASLGQFRRICDKNALRRTIHIYFSEIDLLIIHMRTIKSQECNSRAI